jgi:acetyl-CoA carboxylase biotin carboxylase subunit
MGETARRVIEISGYNNAGTVEFLLDENKNFYFLEVNARIQVEHPVTELVTGVDLVKQQIAIAAGNKLSITQENLQQRGHAIECRIYAEDPENNFYPSYGKLLLVKEPQGPGIRCDSGIYTGLEVPYHYDPILSKLIVWDENRERTIQKMKIALSDYIIMGVKTQIPFMLDILDHPQFKKGQLHTHFIAEHFAQWVPSKQEDNRNIALLAAAVLKLQKTAQPEKRESRTSLSPWQLLGRWEFFSKS